MHYSATHGAGLAAQTSRTTPSASGRGRFGPPGGPKRPAQPRPRAAVGGLARLAAQTSRITPSASGRGRFGPPGGPNVPHNPVRERPWEVWPAWRPKRPAQPRPRRRVGGLARLAAQTSRTPRPRRRVGGLARLPLYASRPSNPRTRGRYVRALVSFVPSLGITTQSPLNHGCTSRMRAVLMMMERWMRRKPAGRQASMFRMLSRVTCVVAPTCSRTSSSAASIQSMSPESTKTTRPGDQIGRRSLAGAFSRRPPAAHRAADGERSDSFVFRISCWGAAGGD